MVEYSIAEAKSRLSDLVRTVESSGAVQLTRRGHAVAVVMSVSEYRRLTADRQGFWDNLETFRQRHALADGDDEWLGGLRDQAVDRDVELP